MMTRSAPTRALTWAKPSTMRKWLSTLQAAITSARSSGEDANGIASFLSWRQQPARMRLGTALGIHHPARDVAERGKPDVVVSAQGGEDLVEYGGDQRPP